MDAEFIIWNYLLDINLVHLSQTLAMRTGTFGRVEGEHVRSWILIGDTCYRIHETLGVGLSLLGTFLKNHHHAVALFHSRRHTLADAFLILFLHHQFIDHSFYIVVLVAVGFHIGNDFEDVAVESHVEIPLSAHAFEEFAVMTLALAYEGSEQEDSLALIIAENHVDDLFLGIFHHLLATLVAVGSTGAGIEQAEIVVNLGGCSHGRAGILVGGFLFDADDRTQSRNLVNIRAFHVSQEVAGIGRESFDISALTFGKDGVESQRTLARTRESGNHGEGITRNLHINVLEVVDPCAPYIYLFF